MPLWKSKCHSEKANAILMVEYYWIVIWEWHLLFPEKGDATPGCLCLGFWTLICHLRMSFAFSGKKQMPLLEVFAWVFGLLSVIWEWHLLFPEKANATPGGLCLGFWTLICHLKMEFSFFGKSKCYSWRPLLGFHDSYLSSENGIFFFRKKQMPPLKGLCAGYWNLICHLRMAFAFFGKSKCHSWRPLLEFHATYLSSENGICFFRIKQMPPLEGLCFRFLTVICHLRMAFAFSGKSKCYSEKENASILKVEYTVIIWYSDYLGTIHKV